MEDLNMHLHAVQLTQDFIFVGGSKNNKSDSENGIVAFERGIYNTKKVNFFQTSDKIISLTIFDPKSSKKEEIEISDLEIKIISEDEKVNKKSILIGAIGETNFYLLKYTNDFQLITKFEKKIEKVILTNHLILIDSNGEMYGFYDVEKNTPKEIEKSSIGSKINILKKDQNLLYCENSDNEKWDNAFLKDGKLHKVCFENNKSTFVFDGIDAEVDGKIKNIFCKKGNLAFYTTYSKGSLLNINGEDIRLPKISAIDEDGTHVLAATETGDVYVYENGKEINKLISVDNKITDISLLGNTMVYTTLLGMGEMNIKKKKIKKQYGLWISLIALILMILLFMFFSSRNK